MTEKRIPFDLQRAVIGESAYTQDGHEVTNFRYFNNLSTSWCVAAVLNGAVIILTEDGRYKYDDESIDQLYMKPKVTTHYANVYRNDNGTFYLVYSQLEEKFTIKAGKESNNYMKTISFEVES